jgi:raffinose/stachyose/melibiose transport system substrate-binding protein
MWIKKVLTLLVVGVLAAHVGGPQTAVAEDVELTIWVWTFSGTTNETIEKITRAFEKLNPGMTVTIEERGVVEHQDQMRIVMGTDAAPDLYFMWAGLGLGGWYVQRGGSLPLNDTYETLGWHDRFVASGIRASTYAGGELHGVPFRLHGINLYYRKDLFEKAGIDSEPTTYEELIAANDKLVAAGIIPLTMGGKDSWHIMRLLDVLTEYTCGAETHDALLTLGKSWADEACATEAWTEFARWTRGGYSHKDLLGIDSNGAFLSWLAGDGAMMLEGDWMMNKLVVNEQDLENFGMFPFPTGTHRIFFYSENLYISSNTKHPDEAVKFLDYFTSLRVQQKYLGMLGTIATVKGLTYPAEQPALHTEWVDYFDKTPDAFLIGDQALPLDVKFEYWRLIDEVNAGTTDPADAGKVFQEFIDNYLANQ